MSSHKQVRTGRAPAYARTLAAGRNTPSPTLEVENRPRSTTPTPRAECRLPVAARLLSLEESCLLCTEIDDSKMMERLNSLLDTEFALGINGVSNLFTYLRNGGLDFGTAYASLRQIWPETSYEFTMILPLLVGRQEHFKRLSETQANECFRRHRQSPHKRTQPGMIKEIRPRRLWDLYANRVVPYCYSKSRNYRGSHLDDEYWAISHSWTQEMVAGKSFVKTSLNNGDWLVPVPQGVDLEKGVRQQLLDLGAEYVWIDVLCLRQRSGTDNRLKDSEWQFDLPTLGLIYNSKRRVVRYLNGLGLPYDHTQWENERHWRNRVWTLQESCLDTIDAGLPEHDGLRRITLEEIDRHLRHISKLQRLRQDVSIGQEFLLIIQEIRKRKCTNPVDRICVITNLFCSPMLPIYLAEEQPEDAWSRCVQHMTSTMQAELLFSFAFPGSELSWRPDWRQLMSRTTKIGDDAFGKGAVMAKVYETGEAEYLGPSFEGYFTKLGRNSGTIDVVPGFSDERISVTLHGGLESSSGLYIFVGNPHNTHWVMCRDFIPPLGEDFHGHAMRLCKVNVARFNAQPLHSFWNDHCRNSMYLFA